MRPRYSCRGLFFAPQKNILKKSKINLECSKFATYICVTKQTNMTKRTWNQFTGEYETSPQLYYTNAEKFIKETSIGQRLAINSNIAHSLQETGRQARNGYGILTKQVRLIVDGINYLCDLIYETNGILIQHGSDL